MDLRKYTDEDFNVLNSWITDADLLFQFAGTAWTFPLTRKQMQDYQALHPDRQFYIAHDDHQQPFAFGEIIIGDINTPRLGRLLVGEKESRGKGLGLHFVNMLVKECKRLFSCHTVYLYVFEDNVAGLRCYQKAGFEFDNDKKINFTLGEKSHTALIMKRLLA